MQKKTNSYVEAVKQATAEQLKWEKLGLPSDRVNKWSRYMITDTAKAQGKALREI